MYSVLADIALFIITAFIFTNCILLIYATLTF